MNSYLVSDNKLRLGFGPAELVYKLVKSKCWNAADRTVSQIWILFVERGGESVFTWKRLDGLNIISL